MMKAALDDEGLPWMTKVLIFGVFLGPCLVHFWWLFGAFFVIALGSARKGDDQVRLDAGVHLHPT